MLISGLTGDETGEGQHTVSANRDLDFQYQTTDDLYDAIANKNNNGNYADDTLPTSDLVILYKNIDIDSNSADRTELLKQRNTSNQYVEKFVYNDEPDSEGSECNEAYSNKDLLDLVLINSDRLDFMNPPSLNYDLGDLELHRSDITKYKDIYINDKLNKCNTFMYTTSELNNPIFASSLLDYICFDGTDTDCNFFMESVIKYVKHTIDQLKRISNGDYLTDKAKEKWKQVENIDHDVKDNMVLAVSPSIPLHIDRNVTDHIRNDECSEVDVNFLSNILQNKVIIQIPREIFTPFKLLNKVHLNDPLVRSKVAVIDQVTNEKSKQMVVQLNHSIVARQSIGDTKSIVIFKANPVSRNENFTTAMIPLPYWPLKKSSDHGNGVRIVEIQNSEHEIAVSNTDTNSNVNQTEYDSKAFTVRDNCDICTDKNNSEDGHELFDSKDTSSSFGSDMLVTSDISNAKPSLSRTLTNDLTLSLESVNMDCVPEETSEDLEQLPESIRRKSPIKKVRVKSPYENKSHLLEEKKRKKLLEIRERREKKKMAMNENCRIRKHKFYKTPILTQHSSSVTKLSITNKSFYNSIYGQNTNVVDNITTKYKVRKEKKDDLVDQTSLEKLEIDEQSIITEFGGSSQENLKQSYYLDDPVTEMMNTQNSECSSVARDLLFETHSTDSNEYKTDEITAPNSVHIKCRDEKHDRFHGFSTKGFEGVKEIPNNVTCSSHQLKPVPSKTPKENEFDDCNLKNQKTVEFKKSIHKIYDLMNKLHENEIKNKIKLECNNSKTDYTIDGISNNDLASSTAYCSNSGTSLKHRSTASNHSTFSFGKLQNIEDKNVADLQTGAVTSAVPKVIISTKQQLNNETDTGKKGRKKVTLNPCPKDPGNPLKAISQLLHELENKRKIRRKTSDECKSVIKKAEVPFEGRTVARPVSITGRPRLQQSAKHDLQTEKNVKSFLYKDYKPFVLNERTRMMQRQARHEEKRLDKFPTRKLIDIIDEVKEAKGEAVRGPSKFHSRLDTLAQPKKSYVQAHSEEYLNRRGRNLMADRLQRLAGTVAHSQLHDRISAAGAKVTFKRIAVTADLPSPTVRQSPHLERAVQHRRPVDNSSVRKQSQFSESISYQERRRPDLLEPMKTKNIPVDKLHSTYNNERLPVADITDGILQCNASKTRIPLIPHDLDFGSVQSSLTEEESTAIGKKIHYMINNLINSKPLDDALTKSAETEHSKDKIFQNLNKMLTKTNQIEQENASSVHLDYHAVIFDDKYLETAIEDIPNNQFEENSTENHCARIHGPIIEIQKLQNSLHRQISMGSFQKRLRLKKITLTPKQSTQNVLILQSGDDGSVLLNLERFNTNKSEDAAILSAMAKTQLEPILSSLPLQIMTVGYAFPKYSTTKCNSSVGISVCKHNQLIKNTSKKENSFEMNIAEQYTNKHEKFLHDAVSSFNIYPATCEKALPNVTKPLKSQPSVDDQFDDRISLKDERKNVNIDNCTVQTKCTSSLDVLVTLLNEIQNITECHISNTDNKKTRLIQDTLKIDNVENKGSHELVSMTSLDKLRQLDSSQSIYSLYISNDECEAADNNQTSDLMAGFRNMLYSKKSNGDDKEINVDFRQDTEVLDAFTNIPSKIFPVLSHSTHITDPLEGILSKPSTQMLPALLPDHESSHSSSFICKNKFIEILGDSSVNQIGNEPRKFIEGQLSAVSFNLNFGQNDLEIKSTFVDNKTQMMNKLCVHVVDRDPLFKVKRDILVTVYSMLVITVFAALSFPDMFYYIF